MYMTTCEKELGLQMLPLSYACSMCQCRVCYEEEEESSTSMECPCACTGSLKFAHRECIQRWCEEKGNTICEICLQKFEPNYLLLPKKVMLDMPVTIRGSLEIPRLNYGSLNPSDNSNDEAVAEDYPACSAMAEMSFSYCRLATILMTIILLFRHLLGVLNIGVDNQYALTLVTVVATRASLILLPFYLIMHVIAAIQHFQWRRYQQQLHGLEGSSAQGMEEAEDDEQQNQHIIDMHF